MNLEISTNHRISLPAEQAVLELYTLGFREIQLGTPHYVADIAKLNKLRKELRLDYSVHAPFLATKDFMANAAYKDETKRQHSEDIFKQSIANAQKLAVSKIVIHIYEPDTGESDFTSLIKTLNNLLPQLDKGQRLCLENKYRNRMDTPLEDELEAVLEAVNDERLEICFDTGHAMVDAGGDKPKVLARLDKLAHKIGDVHLVPGSAENDIHIPYQKDPHFYRGVISRLRKADYKGDLTLEVLPEISEADILEGARYIRGTIAAMLADDM